jgi:hypothetical protein
MPVDPTNMLAVCTAWFAVSVVLAVGATLFERVRASRRELGRVAVRVADRSYHRRRR